MRRIRVIRHHIGFRLLHWLFVIEGVILALTGMQLGGILGIRVLPEATRATHVVTGLAWIFTVIVFVYYFVITGDYKWYGLRRIPLSLKFMIAEAKAWFGIGPHIEEPIRYNPRRGDYVEKIVPTEVVVWWIYVVFGLVLALTGLAMAFPEQFTFVYWITEALAGVLGGGPYAVMRATHRLAMFLVVTVVIMHIYAAWVFKMLRSITLGDRDEPIVE